ncbi:MAG TPA: sugar transferase [Gemmatimonadales bacterium]|nr:sugar transferase [Gemmatimonadales bacterium]
MNGAPRLGYLRAVDLGFALLLAPVWAPLLLLGILAAAMQGPPIFYRASRLGRRGEIFPMLKLRTMVRNADQVGPAVAAGSDPRVTRIGRLLRRTKLDELPQFLHVLSGRMSIVGPRPEAPHYLPHYTPAGLRSLEAKPGITGYGALYFFSAERSAPPADFENRYVKELLPTKLLLDERCWLDLQARPFRTTLRLLGLTLSAVLLRETAGLSPTQLETRFLRQPGSAQ